MSEELKIKLPLYEGPLDLLLDLIRRQKIDIYDIPISQITRQYLEFLQLMKEMNVDVAAEFLWMAAQLIYIKSRLLLPADPDADAEEEEDPRNELVRRLLEYEQFRNAAQMLHQRELVEKAGWTRPGRIEIDPEELEPEITATLYDMMSVFRDVLKRLEERPVIDLVREEYTVEQMSSLVLDALNASPGGLRFTRLLEGFQTRRAMVTVFLALLELIRVHAIVAAQEHAFADIHLRRNPWYERTQSFSVA